ncbi:MAG TPA: hypothetical protein PK718_07245 [Candidatus Methanofastidiosa archaeon]|nr:hypothetical protein [Candidatus Methanofastidiosa archaeon]
MNKDKERNTWVLIAIISTICLLFIIYLQEWSAKERMAMTASSVLGIAVFFGFGWYMKERMREKAIGIPSSDERTEALNGMIFKYTFLSSFWAIIILAWFNILSRYTGRSQMPSDITLVIALSAMFSIWVFFNLIVHRRYGHAD